MTPCEGHPVICRGTVLLQPGYVFFCTVPFVLAQVVALVERGIFGAKFRYVLIVMPFCYHRGSSNRGIRIVATYHCFVSNGLIIVVFEHCKGFEIVAVNKKKRVAAVQTELVHACRCRPMHSIDACMADPPCVDLSRGAGEVSPGAALGFNVFDPCFQFPF